MVKLDLGLVLVICAKLGGGGDEVLSGRNIVNHVVDVNKGKMSMCETWPPIRHYFDIEFSS
jgi:hypothetical protein